MPQLLQEWLSAQAAQRPEATAVVSEERSMSYSELEALSNQLARTLKEAGCGRGERVCLLAPKSALSLAAWIGIYKADCVYVPLDPDNPVQRIAKMVADCECRCLITASACADKAEGVIRAGEGGQSLAMLWLDETVPEMEAAGAAQFSLSDLRAQPVEPLVYANQSGDAAHILFTSGSTGEPKGVVISHANVIHFISWAVDYFAITADDRLSGHTPLHFDLSVFDLFATIAAGAQLHLVPGKLDMHPYRLAEWIRKQRLTQWFSVPSLLNYMGRFQVPRKNEFPDMRRLIWCGEVFPTPTLMFWMNMLPHVAFTNLYGPTETTIASSYYTLSEPPDDESQSIPIGTPCPGEELRVLDRNLKPVGVGEEGELYIGGAGLSPGYWKDEERTAEAFLPDPESGQGQRCIYRTGDRAKLGADGYFHYLGRNDEQIKTRGYRVELGEIEAAMNTLPDVRESAVVALHTGGFENMRICCAYAVADNSDRTVASLRRDLSARVPSYMIPYQWKAFSVLPRNGSNKIDKTRIKRLFSNDESLAR